MAVIVRYPQCQLAAGWNNAAGLVAIETLLNVEGLFPYPFGSFDPGIFKIRGDGSAYVAGKPSFKWPFSVLLWTKHPYLMTTFCAGGYSGKITVRTRANDSATYVNYNAIMTLPKLPEVRTESQRFEDYTIIYSRLVAI